jgi:hypothetical protein
MRNIFTFSLILLISTLCHSQDTFKVKGEINLVSYYQGGMELPDEYRSPKPNPDIPVIIVKFNGVDKYSTYVTTITSDKDGKFEIDLPKGKYGYVTVDQKDQLKKEKGVFTPIPPKVNENEKQVFKDEGVSDYWTINSYQPFEVSAESHQTMILTHYLITVCYTCP